jgi:branched-chain amino acid transport system ATP-binding protein
MTALAPADVVLSARDLCKAFGGIQVARHLAFDLKRGARHALIGPNGAGKTTFLNLLTGRLSADSGAIFIAGEDVTHLPPEARVKRGLARTFQINSQFRSLTVLDNVCLAAAEHAGLGHCWWHGGYPSHVVDASLALLRRLDLWRHADTIVGELPYGRQRIIEIAMALALEPSVLLLDEPAAGVPSSDTRLVLDVVEGLAPDIAVLLIEHDMGVVFRVAREITVLVQGAILMTGSPEMVEQDARVREIYLGKRRG